MLMCAAVPKSIHASHIKSQKDYEEDQNWTCNNIKSLDTFVVGSSIPCNSVYFIYHSLYVKHYNFWRHAGTHNVKRWFTHDSSVSLCGFMCANTADSSRESRVMSGFMYDFN